MESKGSDGIFDGVLGIEAEMRTRGWEEGYTVGREKGIAEGKDLGKKQGSVSSSEIGFYLGCCVVWAEMAEIYKGKFTKRQRTRIEGLIDLIKKYPLGEANADGMTHILDKIRAKFKVLMAQLGHARQVSTRSTPDASGAADSKTGVVDLSF
ncbi:hypothetical protein AAMO2058_000707300 [Amorphochlora amoebiformis]